MVVPRVNETEVSPEAIELSVAIVTPSNCMTAEPPVASPATIVAIAVRLVFVAVNRLVRIVPPIGVTANDVGALGATVSITSAALRANEPVAPGVINVVLAALPAVSRMVPLFNANAEVD